MDLNAIGLKELHMRPRLGEPTWKLSQISQKDNFHFDALVTSVKNCFAHTYELAYYNYSLITSLKKVEKDSSNIYPKNYVKRNHLGYTLFCCVVQKYLNFQKNEKLR